MKKFIIGLCLMAMCISVLTGCQGNKTPDTTTLVINKDGSLDLTIVESFSKSYYDVNELTDEITKEVSSYNLEHGENRVVLSDIFTTEEENVVVAMKYGSYNDYTLFNQMILYVGDAMTAKGTQYSFDEILSSANGKNDTISFAQAAENGYKLCVISESMRVKFPGKVLYFCDDVNAISAKEVNVSLEDGLAYIVYE